MRRRAQSCLIITGIRVPRELGSRWKRHVVLWYVTWCVTLGSSNGASHGHGASCDVSQGAPCGAPHSVSRGASHSASHCALQGASRWMHHVVLHVVRLCMRTVAVALYNLNNALHFLPNATGVKQSSISHPASTPPPSMTNPRKKNPC